MVVARREQKGVLGSFSLATAAKHIAVLYHIECTQGLDKVGLNHDWLRFLQAG